MKSSLSLARRLLVLVVLALLAVSVYGAEPNPRNVILIIGDGMGIGAITAARCAGPGENGKLVLDSMPVTGLVKTHSENRLVTDSAASGTALATGHKTENGRISVDSNGRNLPTILDLAISMGKSAGVVTNDAVTGATPAVFYAHVDSRNKQDEIAAQLVVSRLSVAMGSGRRYFVPSSAGEDGRSDGRDLVSEAKQAGFDVTFEKRAMEASRSGRILGLFSFGESGPTLEDMLAKAISVLSKDPSGFFLMAESCLPDKGGHSNDAKTVLRGVEDLDSALRRALEFARTDKGTLIVVTSDHETGGLAVLDRDDKNPEFKPGWIHGGHTGNMVAVYAFGPGAERFTGTHDNTDIPRILAGLWGKTLGQ